MDRRTRILTLVFGASVAYAVVSQVVYPRWIEPLVTIDERIAARRKDLDELEALEDRVERAKTAYRELLVRSGSPDPGKVTIDLRGRLNDLIEKHHLQAVSVSPDRLQSDNKTGLTHLFLDVSAEASLKSAVDFLKDIAELPQLLRTGSVRISPSSAARKDKASDRVNLVAPLELLVPPAHKYVRDAGEGKSTPPESHKRHLDRAYAAIWERKPFTEYEPARPLIVKTKQPNVTVKVGGTAQLQATVSGGNGRHMLAWSPAEGLSDARSLNPRVDTSKPGSMTYILTVTDERGQTGSDTVTVVVQEAVVQKDPSPEPVKPAPPPPPPREQPWKDGASMQICMTLIRSDGTARIAELMVYNSKSRSTDYYGVGDSFDGGRLVYVHPRGGVVRRNNEYFLYPIGITLDAAVDAAQGTLHPELQDAVRRIQEAETAPKRTADSTGPQTPQPDFVGPVQEGAGAAAGPQTLGPELAEMVGPPAGPPTVEGTVVPPPAKDSGESSPQPKSGSRRGNRRAGTNPQSSGGTPSAAGEKPKQPPPPAPE